MDIIPENLIDAFYLRIKKLIECTKSDLPINEEHPLFKREFDRIKLLNNGLIPNKIKKLYDSGN